MKLKIVHNIKGNSVANQLTIGLEDEFKKKEVQFYTLFQVLSHSHPLCHYEREHFLFRHLKIKNLPRKYWSESLGWEMSEHLHACVLTTLKHVMQFAFCKVHLNFCWQGHCGRQYVLGRCACLCNWELGENAAFVAFVLCIWCWHYGPTHCCHNVSFVRGGKSKSWRNCFQTCLFRG